MSVEAIGRPFGLAPDAGGNGTTPKGLQRIIGSKWMMTGIINGCAVTGTPTMQYQVGAGAAVVFLDVAAMRAVEVPIDAVTVPTNPAPASGSRLDLVYVDPVTYTVKVSTVAPAGAAVLARIRVGAGITGTNSAVILGDNVFALPYGGRLGQLNPFWQDGAAPGSLAVTGLIDWWVWEGGVQTTSDRQVELQVDQSIYAGATGLGAMKYRFYVSEDGAEKLEATFDLEYSQPWQQRYYRHPFYLLAGRRYTMRITRVNQWDATPRHFGGEAVDAFARGAVRIVDLGVAA